jgi:hypothetical protein
MRLVQGAHGVDQFCLRKIIREQFAGMHEERDVLDDWRAFLARLFEAKKANDPMTQ